MMCAAQRVPLHRRRPHDRIDRRAGVVPRAAQHPLRRRRRAQRASSRATATGAWSGLYSLVSAGRPGADHLGLRPDARAPVVLYDAVGVGAELAGAADLGCHRADGRRLRAAQPLQGLARPSDGAGHRAVGAGRTCRPPARWPTCCCSVASWCGRCWCFVSLRARDRAAGVQRAPGQPLRSAIAVAIGTAAWAGFAVWLHRPVIGIAAFG